jgi:Family of unknown function (DUF6328)
MAGGTAPSAADRPPEGPQRSETPDERADRNFTELLQELRVAQTGVQILFAFLLTLGFSSRFQEVDLFGLVVYVCALMFCAGATAMLIGPVAVHRKLFGRGMKPSLVDITARLSRVGLALLLLAVSCSLLFALDIVLPRWLALTLAGALVVLFVTVWYVLPNVVLRRRGGRGESPARRG